MTSEKERVGKLIKKLRENAGLSQRELSEMIPMSQSGLHRIEIGEVYATKKARLIAKALGVNPDMFEYNYDQLENKKEEMKNQNLPIINWSSLHEWIFNNKKMGLSELICWK